MRLASYRIGDFESFGYVEHDEIVDLRQYWPNLVAALDEHAHLQDIFRRGGSRIRLSEIELLPPIPHASKILCAGFNFSSHLAEVSKEAGQKPTLFVRFADSLVGHCTPVERPASSVELDWEGELGVIIGREAWHLKPDTALDVVAGYTCVAENSVRDWQAHGTQATAGKNFVRTGAMGPWMTTPDEAGEVSDLELTTRLNGEVVQQASLSELIYSVTDLLCYITSFTPLRTGDIVSTGTPEGTGFRRNPPRFLSPGDILEVDIPRVGCLKNGVIDGAVFD